MGRPRGIPDRLADAVLAEAGNNKSTRQIAAWLLATHKIKVGHNAVASFLRERKKERRATTEAVIAERVGKHVTKDLDILAEQLQRQASIANHLYATMVDEDGQPRETVIDIDTGAIKSIGLLGTIGRTPIAAVHQQVVGRVESIIARKLDLGGASGGKPTGPVGPVTIVPPESDD